MFSVTLYKNTQDNKTNYSLNREDSLGLLDSLLYHHLV